MLEGSMPRAVWQGKAQAESDKVEMVLSACCPQSRVCQGRRHHDDLSLEGDGAVRH
jgi:hypothetical protein